MRKIITFLCAFLSIFSAGCLHRSDYREISRYDIVAGFGVDITQSGRYLLTAELVRFSSGGLSKEVEAKIVRQEGDSLFEAAAEMTGGLGRPLYWGHVQVIVLGEKTAAQAFEDVLDFVTRNETNNVSAQLFVAKGQAGLLFEKNSAPQGELVSHTLLEMLQVAADYGKTIKADINTATGAVLDDGFSPALPALMLAQDGEQWVPAIEGCAVFCRERPVLWLDALQSQMANMIRGKLKSAYYQLPLPQGYCSLLFSDIRTHITAVPGDLPVMDIHVRIKGGITAFPGAEEALSREDFNRLSQTAAQSVKEKLESCVQSLQQGGSGDVLHLSSAVAAQMPAYWRAVRENWTQIFPQLPVNIRVDVELQNY